MPPRIPPVARNPKAATAINVLAAKIALAQGHGWAVTLTLHGRERRKVRGHIEARIIDRSRRMTGRDGESNLLVQIAGEQIPMERIAEIARTRQPVQA